MPDDQQPMTKEREAEIRSRCASIGTKDMRDLLKENDRLQSLVWERDEELSWIDTALNDVQQARAQLSFVVEDNPTAERMKKI